MGKGIRSFSKLTKKSENGEIVVLKRDYKISADKLQDISILVHGREIKMEQVIAFGFLGLDYGRNDIYCENREVQIPLEDNSAINIQINSKVWCVRDYGYMIKARETWKHKEEYDTYVYDISATKINKRLALVGGCEQETDGVYWYQKVDESKNVLSLECTSNISVDDFHGITPLMMNSTGIKVVRAGLVNMHLMNDTEYNLDLLSADLYKVRDHGSALHVDKWDQWDVDKLKYIDSYNELYNCSFYCLNSNEVIKAPKILGRGALGFICNSGKGYALTILWESEHIAPDVFNISMDEDVEFQYNGDCTVIITDNENMHNKLVEAAKKSIDLGIQLNIIIDNEIIECKDKVKYKHD